MIARVGRLSNGSKFSAITGSIFAADQHQYPLDSCNLPIWIQIEPKVITFGDDQEPDSESSESNDDDFDLPELDLSDLAGSGEERSEQDADVQIDVEEPDLGDIDEYHIELGDEGASQNIERKDAEVQTSDLNKVSS